MRVANDKPCKNGGWLWPLSSAPRPVRQWRPVVAQQQDFSFLMREFESSTKDEVCWLASSLGVSCDSLRSMGCAWAPAYRAFAFPMLNGDGKTVGIRLRTEDGNKFAVRGSKQGLFCSSYPASETGFVTEGPTDTAAAISIGLWAVGRPSCLGGNELLKTLFRNRGVRRAVILSDNDTPGIQGAQRLACELGLPSALLVLPAKDLREFTKLGGTRQMIETLLHDTVWRRP